MLGVMVKRCHAKGMSAIDLGFPGVWVSGKGSGLLALWLEL